MIRPERDENAYRTVGKGRKRRLGERHVVLELRADRDEHPWLARFVEVLGITSKTHDILATDDHAVTLVDATATRGGKTLTYRTAEIYHIRDGKISERWAFSDDTAAITAFFA